MDFGSVGIFNRGKGLVKLFQSSFLGAIAPVIQSEFADQYRNGRDVRATYYKSIEYVTVITWPVYIFLAIFSEEIILLLFGPQWTSAAPLATAFCFPAIISSLFAFARKLLIASGEVARIVKILTITELLRVLFTFIGSLFSLNYIVWSFSLVALLSFFLHSYYLNLYYKVKIAKVVRLSVKSLAVSVFCIVPSVMTFNVIKENGFNLFVMLSVTFTVLLITWSISIYLVNHSIKSEITKALQKCISTCR
jgi:O-antigen/teichoic acid export membrane protein